MNWVYFRYENLSTEFVREIWNFLCFKYGNLTSDIPRNIEFLYFIYEIWTLIFSIICAICCMSHMNIWVRFSHIRYGILYFPFQHMRAGLFSKILNSSDTTFENLGVDFLRDIWNSVHVLIQALLQISLLKNMEFTYDNLNDDFPAGNM